MDDRSKYIGASEAAAVLGLSRWQSPLQIWAIKTGQIVPSEKENEAMELGKELEDYVARRFMRKTGKKVHRVNETLYHPKYPFIAANLDRRVTGENAVLECKTASAWKYREWKDEEIPQEYLIQVLHQLAVGGFKKGYIACLIGNHKFVWKEIIRDEKMIANLIEKEVNFWNTFIVPKVMPMSISALDSDILYQIFPAQQGNQIQLTDDAVKIIENIDSLEADLLVVEKQILQQKNVLKAMLKENEVGLTNKYKVIWKLQKQIRLNIEMLREELPEVYHKYSKPTEFRKLNIYERKEE